MIFRHPNRQRAFWRRFADYCSSPTPRVGPVEGLLFSLLFVGLTFGLSTALFGVAPMHWLASTWMESGQ